MEEQFNNVTPDGADDWQLKPPDSKNPRGPREVFTPYIRLRNGRVLWAKECGRKAFRFLVKK